MDRPEDAQAPGPGSEKGYSGGIPTTRRAWWEFFFVGMAAGAVLFCVVAVIVTLGRFFLPRF